MKTNSLFSFVLRYLGFLKAVPLLPLVFDSMLKLQTLWTNAVLLDWMDELEEEILTWQGTSTGLHQYGGVQFNAYGKEIGHLHSNGLLDVLYSKRIKAALMKQGRIEPHHIFTDSGWISFYIKKQEDKNYAKELLEMAYWRLRSKD